MGAAGRAGRRHYAGNAGDHRLAVEQVYVVGIVGWHAIARTCPFDDVKTIEPPGIAEPTLVEAAELGLARGIVVSAICGSMPWKAGASMPMEQPRLPLPAAFGRSTFGVPIASGSPLPVVVVVVAACSSAACGAASISLVSAAVPDLAVLASLLSAALASAGLAPTLAAASGLPAAAVPPGAASCATPVVGTMVPDADVPPPSADCPPPVRRRHCRIPPAR